MANLPTFRHPELLYQALTHRSYINEHPDIIPHNERLEFLGDAVLNFLCGEFLYQQYPHLPEGKLTPLRAALVDEKQLAAFATQLQLGLHLKLGKGAEREGGRQNLNLLSSAFEAIVGAYFLDNDSDIQPVRAFVQPLFAAVSDRLIAADSTNYKSRFQEWALANYGKNPHYECISETGPDHAKQFVVQVQVQAQIYGSGTGSKKQDAQKAAAKNALKGLGLL